MANENNSGWGQAAAAGIATAGSYVLGVAKSKREWKYQQQAMDKQTAINKAMWDYQNAYNTPQQQMERFKAAGLNPYLIYGQPNPGNAGPLEAPTVPSRHAADIPDIPNGMAQYLSGRQADAQYAATMQTVESQKTRSTLVEVQTALENLKLMRENLRQKNYKDLNQAEIDQQKWITLRLGELYSNEKTKGGLMDQLVNVRKQGMAATAQGMAEKELDIEFKKNRNELARHGIYQSDSPILRTLIQASKRMGIDLGELLEQGVDKLRYLFD